MTETSPKKICLARRSPALPPDAFRRADAAAVPSSLRGRAEATACSATSKPIRSRSPADLPQRATASTRSARSCTGSSNHPDVAAAILPPAVSQESLQTVRNHGHRQVCRLVRYSGADRNLRDKFGGHPWYAMGAEFVGECDAAAFAAKAGTMPLSAFAPTVRRLMATLKRTIYDNLKS